MNTTKTELTIDQDKVGYRYSIEPFLIADFASPLPEQSLLDIGTGCGIIPILMLQREPSLQITAIEIQENSCKQAQNNFIKNEMTKQISLISADFLKEQRLLSGTFDNIVSNPPYRKIQTGHINPDSSKAIARHEITLDLNSMLKKAARLLKVGGQITLAYPPERMSEVLKELENRNLFPSRAQFIHGTLRASAKIFLVSALKGKMSDFEVIAPLTVYNEDGNFSKEMEGIYASFNYTDRSN